MPDHKNEFKLAKFVSGSLAGGGILCILLAKNWAILSIGWVVFMLFLFVGIIQRFKRPVTSGEIRFEVGPLIFADLEKINNWIKPVAIFVLLLGLLGVVVSFSDEEAQHPGYAIFLVGIGIACLGIGYVNRPLIVVGYGLWGIAGAVVCFTALAIENPLAMAQAFTLGMLLFLGGVLATYGFLYGRTRIYEEGILFSNGICPWNQFTSWSLITINKVPHLQLTVGKWKPIAAVRPDTEGPLRTFLNEKFKQ